LASGSPTVASWPLSAKSLLLTFHAQAELFLITVGKGDSYHLMKT